MEHCEPGEGDLTRAVGIPGSQQETFTGILALPVDSLRLLTGRVAMTRRTFAAGSVGQGLY